MFRRACARPPGGLGWRRARPSWKDFSGIYGANRRICERCRRANGRRRSFTQACFGMAVGISSDASNCSSAKAALFFVSAIGYLAPMPEEAILGVDDSLLES